MIKSQIGYFICNIKSIGEEANNLLKEMNFGLRFPWNYDPYGLIEETKLKKKIFPYAHVPNPEIENFMNHTK
jgi:hypothetical protein